MLKSIRELEKTIKENHQFKINSDGKIETKCCENLRENYNFLRNEIIDYIHKGLITELYFKRNNGNNNFTYESKFTLKGRIYRDLYKVLNKMKVNKTKDLKYGLSKS